MTQKEADEQYGPVGAPQEDLDEQPRYDDTTPATVDSEPATPQVEDLPPQPGEHEGESGAW